MVREKNYYYAMVLKVSRIARMIQGQVYRRGGAVLLVRCAATPTFSLLDFFFDYKSKSTP